MMLNYRGKARLKILALAAGTAIALSGCAAPAQGAAGGDAEHAKLTYWYWAENDAPGANAWMKGRVAAYEKLHPGVTIALVPQAIDTLIGTFSAAAQTKTGPDIATQWATIPVLSQAWAGAIAPISDYLSKDQMSTWIGTAENTDKGKIWGMPMYLMGNPFVYNKELLAKVGVTEAPKTFDELLSTCESLKKAGITPIGMGNKDGFFGAWFFSNFGKQNLNSVGELKDAIVGKADLSDKKYTGYLTQMHDLISNGCLNDNISSLTLQQGFTLFDQGKAAMTWAPDGVASGWAKSLGEDKVGVAKSPKAGTGTLADVYNTTQSSTAFITSWSKNPKAAAQFLAWLHEPENLASWYAATGVFPADTKFLAKDVKSHVGQALWALDSEPGAVWLENYLPPSVDGDGNMASSQVIASGGSVADAVKVFQTAVEKWRKTNPDEFDSYSKWAAQ